MEKRFMQGCEAVAEAAIRSGCRFFAGYPITPQNEIPEYMSRHLPERGGVFIQGESEIAAVNMVFGASSVGTRAMTSSSGLGICLKTECISYLAGTRLPAVIVNVSRGGPGLADIMPAQQDYLQATKAMGSGGHLIKVYAPSTIQESVDLTCKAFDNADRDRNPVMILMDGCIGSMMEPVELPPYRDESPDKSDYIVTGCERRKARSIRSFVTTEALPQELENIRAAKMYDRWQREEVEAEEYLLEDAVIVLVAYGITARIARSAVEAARAQGIKAGMLRPITLLPFPYAQLERLDATKVKRVLAVEMSIPGQMVQDVRIGVGHRIPVEAFGRSGGVVISDSEIEEKIIQAVKEGQIL